MSPDPSLFDVSALSGGHDCEETLATLYAYLDGELTSDKRSMIEKHLDACGPCLHVFGFEAELKVLIARSCRESVPDGLKERIAKVLADPGGPLHRS